MPEYLANAHPEATIDVVELDSKLTSIAKEHFFFEQPSNLSIINQDARVFVSQETPEPYDAIVIDVFSDSGIPFSVTTTEYVSDLVNHLSPQGMIIMNVIAGTNPDCNPLLQSIAHSFTTQLQHVALKPVRGATLERRQNILLLASRFNHAAIAAAIPASTDNAVRLTDDFVPTEQLHHRCFAV
jgi:spermidine synthase